MRCMCATPSTVFLKLQAICRLPLILGRIVIPALALGARQNDDVAHALASSLTRVQNVTRRSP